MVSEAEVGGAQFGVVVRVSPRAVVSTAVSLVPVFADDELCGDLSA